MVKVLILACNSLQLITSPFSLKATSIEIYMSKFIDFGLSILLNGNS